MKTNIRISGQLAGNNRLHLHLQRNADGCECFFHDFILKFRTKKQARQALRQAFKNLKSLEPDFYRDGGISYKPVNGLWYDASSAKIEKP